MIGLLQALTYAPQIFSAGVDIYNAFTGKDQDQAPSSPEALVSAIETLPEPDRVAVTQAIMTFKERYQELDTQRFLGLTAGDADHVKATARPEIALRCMRMMEMPFQLLRLFVVVLVIAMTFEWLIEAVTKTQVVSPLQMWIDMAAAGSWQGVLSILGPGYLAAVACIKKYMGCRERDKAQEFELSAGRPLSSSAATVKAAGGVLSGIADLVQVVRK